MTVRRGLQALTMAAVLGGSLGAGLLFAGTASAFQFLGITLFEDQADIDAESVIADPQPYTVTITTNATGELDAAIRGASMLVAEAARPASGAAGLLVRARGDYRRVLGALYSQGYYGGAISIRVGGREADGLPPDTTLPKRVAVEIFVNPGPQFTFGTIEIVNQAPPTSDARDVAQPVASVGLASGQVARSTVVLAAEQLAVTAWRHQGHPKAAIASRDVVADHSTNRVDVTIVVDPDGFARVGDIGVQGTEKMNPDFVVRMTGLQPGAEYDPDDILLSERRLARLDVFRAMRVEEADAISPDGTLPMTVIVEELPLRRFGFGATYSTTDGLGLEGFHLWRNLFGQAERLRLDAKIAGIGFPIATEEFDYAFGGVFTKPGIWTPDTDLVVSALAERTVYDTYTETSANVSAGLTHYFSGTMTLKGAGFYERSRFDDDFGTRDFSLAGLTGEFIFDTRDEATNATRGFFVDVTAEPFYEFVFDNAAFRSTVEARTYFGFGAERRFVLAGRAKIGGIWGPALAETPPDRLFFAGGGGSVRGYPYKGIGVPGPGGTLTGGRYLIEGSVELRAKVRRDIGLVAFVDGGYVAADVFPGLDQLRLGVGMGLRYYTGFGPLRLDLAFPLNKVEPDDPDYALYVGIGQAF